MNHNEYPCYCDDGSNIILDHHGNLDAVKPCQRCKGKGKIELSEELKTIRDLSGALFLLRSSITIKIEECDPIEIDNLENIIDFLNIVMTQMDSFININFDESLNNRL